MYIFLILNSKLCHIIIGNYDRIEILLKTTSFSQNQDFRIEPVVIFFASRVL